MRVMSGIKKLPGERIRTLSDSELVVKLTPYAAEKLRELAASGLWGESAEEVARHMLLAYLRELGEGGWLS